MDHMMSTLDTQFEKHTDRLIGHFDKKIEEFIETRIANIFEIKFNYALEKSKQKTCFNPQYTLELKWHLIDSQDFSPNQTS